MTAVPAATLDHPLWQALSACEIGPPGTAFPFVRRLARENGWTAAKAEAAIGEYRRFCFLAMTAGCEVTPSDEVDQVWHLHLTYSRDYWQRFCTDVLGRDLHHGPTAGGEAERHRFFEQYAQTLRAYQAAFGPPPPAFWPDAQRRLLQDPLARRVHPRDALVITRKRFAAIVALAAVLAAVAGFCAASWAGGLL